jgi:hypothetical protein
MTVFFQRLNPENWLINIDEGKKKRLVLFVPSSLLRAYTADQIHAVCSN